MWPIWGWSAVLGLRTRFPTTPWAHRLTSPLLSHEKQLQHCCWLRGMWRIWRVYFMCVHRVCVTGDLPLRWTVQSQQQLCVPLKCSSRGAKNFINPLNFRFIIAFNRISCYIWKLKRYRLSFTVRSFNLHLKMKNKKAWRHLPPGCGGVCTSVKNSAVCSKCFPKSVIFPLFHTHREPIAEEFMCRSS